MDAWFTQEELDGLSCLLEGNLEAAKEDSLLDRDDHLLRAEAEVRGTERDEVHRHADVFGTGQGNDRGACELGGSFRDVGRRALEDGRCSNLGDEEQHVPWTYPDPRRPTVGDLRGGNRCG